MRLDFASRLEFCDAAKILQQNCFLDFELVIIGGVLILAAAAASEVGAPGLHTMWRRLQDGLHAGSRKTALLLTYAGFNFFPRENKRNEYRFTAIVLFGGKARETVAAVDQLFDVKKQGLIVRQA